MDTTVLEKVVVFILDGISLWSARRRLQREDLKLIDAKTEIPPEDLASLGSKKVFDPDRIARFDNHKKAAHRACARIGVRFLGGYAVPEAEAALLATELDAIGAEFYADKATLLTDYDVEVADWVKQHPDWSVMLKQSILSRDEVDQRIAYAWRSFRVVATEQATSDDVSPLNAGLATEIGGLAGQLYSEIARAAAEVMEKSMLGRDKVTQKILRPIRNIRSKLTGLSFLDPRVKPLIESIDHTLAQLPAAGHIEGLALTALRGIVFILAAEDRMVSHGQMIINGTSVQEALEESVPALRVAAEEAQKEEPVQVTAPAVPASLALNLASILGSTQPNLAPRAGTATPFFAPPPPVVKGPRVSGLFS